LLTKKLGRASFLWRAAMRIADAKGTREAIIQLDA
jgi:hypothetical protein